MKKLQFTLVICCSYLNLFPVTRDYNGTIIPPRGGLIISASPMSFQQIIQNSSPSYGGALNKRFGSGGMATVSLTAGVDGANAIALQSNGQMIMAGSAGGFIGIVRLNNDASLDYSFNSTGKVILPPTAFSGTATSCLCRAIAVQMDGKIVVVGQLGDGFIKFCIARLNSNGSLDTTFNGTGTKVIAFPAPNIGQAYAVAVQSDNKIIVAGTGNSNFAVVQLTSDGSLDLSFNGTGIQLFDFGFPGRDNQAQGMALQADGKIVVMGPVDASNQLGIARLTTSGSLDPAFNGTGNQVVGFGRPPVLGQSVAIQSNGAIIIAGTNGDFFVVTQFTATGAVDPLFNGGGAVVLDTGGASRCTSMLLQPDGKVLLGGYTAAGNSLALFRLTAIGALDLTFNQTGKQIINIGGGVNHGNSMVFQSDWSILLAGSTTLPGDDFAVTQFLNNYYTWAVYEAQYSGQAGFYS
jgi:uncharacterized delta-60 repeat protein